MTSSRGIVVLLTGASGFIGRRVLALLLARGFRVVAGVHTGALPQSLESLVEDVVSLDMEDHAAIRNTVSTVDAVCHIAAYIPSDYEDISQAERCLKVNSLGTLELAASAMQRPGRRFVHLSSSNAYSSETLFAEEESPMYPADRATYYLASKLTGELYVEHLRRRGGLNSVSLRVSSVYGFGMLESAVVSRFMRAAHDGLDLEVRDGGIPAYDFVYVEDIASLAVQALTSGSPGVYNAGSGKASSVLELANCIREVYRDTPISIRVRESEGRVPASFPALAMTKAAKAWGHEPTVLPLGLTKYRQDLEVAISLT